MFLSIFIALCESISLLYTLRADWYFHKVKAGSLRSTNLPDKDDNGDSTVQAVPCKDSDYNLPGVLKSNPP